MTRMEAYITPAPGASDTGEAAPGITKLDVSAVDRKAERELYASRQKIHPKRARGLFRNLKWLVMVVTLGIYYALPWLRWDRGPDLPNQAVLLDMQNNRFFFFFLEIWPQEFYFVTGLLVLSALVLFAVTAAAGRVWCGYACPQTVWTDLMVTIERFWQGDRNERIRLDKSPWTANKIFRKVMTHISWMLVGIATGGAMVFYFRDAPTLAVELVTGKAPYVAYLFLAIFAGFTYLLGGIAREQVCIYMCPWPRIQGAMVDHETLLVSYETQRGEPRGPHKKGQPWEGRGDCIDCRACVAVCPTGIDIRNGPQLECIQCALCVDACNEIMTKIGRPKNLIAYDTIANQEATACGKTAPFKIVRPRTLLYVGMMAIVSAIMLAALLARTVLEINVIADRNPPFVRLSDGGVRNGYTIKILNKLHEPRDFQLTVNGLPNAKLAIVGMEGDANPVIRVATDNLRELRIFVTVPREGLPKLTSGHTAFDVIIRDIAANRATTRSTKFQSP